MTPENKIKIKVMNLKNTHKEIYQRLSNEDIELFYQVNKGEDAPITFDEYWERNDFASAIEEIFSKKYSEDIVREWREEDAQKDVCAYSGLPSPSSYANEEIEVPCSADLDLQMYYESI